MSNAETRTFTVDPHIIQHLIRSQAGTLGKGLVECIMNSIDAAATKVEIALTNTGFTVTDNGHGLRDRGEVLACFEVFGFAHTDKHREFGRFGIGRGQLWAHATTAWRTHTFMLDVDIRARGLDYELSCDLPDVPGLRIDGVFYEPLSEIDRSAVLREMDTLCRYCVIPVIINGKDVRRDPASVKWTSETDEAWIKVSDSSMLDVYNQGVWVRGYSAREMGIGGTLVTKLGHVLALNMSRSDILTQECKLWKALKGVCASLAGNEKEKKVRMTDDLRDFLAEQTLDPAFAMNFEQPLFTLTNGRHVSLTLLCRKLAADAYLTTAEKGDQLAERAMKEQRAVVIAERTLTRFGVATVTEMVATLIERLTALGTTSETWTHRYNMRELERTVQETRVFDAFKDCPVASLFEASVVPKADWNPEHHALLRAMADANRSIAQSVDDERNADGEGLSHSPVRQLVVGTSNAAEAFTDGTSYIAFNVETLSQAIRDGLTGIQRLMGILVHEYIHYSQDSGSHQHDHVFFETFHEVMLGESYNIAGVGIGVFRAFCASRDRLNTRLAKDNDILALDAA